MSEPEQNLENLSPEQIEELMKKNCLFCGLISGDIPSVRVYEDDYFLAFLDINPASEGHVILIPKDHVMSIEEVKPRIFEIAQSIVAAQKRGLGVNGVSVLIPEGPDAGQKLAHASIHMIPRKQNDGLFAWQGQQASEEQLKSSAEKISGNINKVESVAEVQPEVVQKEEAKPAEEVPTIEEEERVP
jgi:histidine triad (HIT) family protein